MIIKGNLFLSDSSIESLGNIVKIEGNLALSRCKNLKSLGSLKEIKGWLAVGFCSNLENLGDLKFIGHKLSVVFSGTKITEEYIRKEKPWLFNFSEWNEE